MLQNAKKIVVATALFLCFSSQAALVQVDWKQTGDGLATLDTVTGIEWLDLTLTDTLSISTVLSRTAVGGQFYGWRLPTQKEVVDLFARQFPLLGFKEDEAVSTIVRYGSEDANTAQFRNLFGTTYEQEGLQSGYFNGGIQGLYVNDNPNASNLPLVLAASIHRATTDKSNHSLYSLNVGNLRHMNYVHSNTGVFLVSDGGVTKSSISNPSLNINNPNAPVNNVSSPMSVLGIFAFMLLAFKRRFSFRADK